MNIRYFDGHRSQAYDAYIDPVYYQGMIDGFVVRYGDTEKRYFAKDYDYLPAVGQSPHALMMTDNAKIEFIHGMPDWLNPSQHRLFHKIWQMERAWAWVGAGVVVAIMLIFGVLKFGIPLASHHIAQNMPADTLMTVGNQTEKYVLNMTKPSTLPKSRQDKIIALYNQINGNPKAKIIVRGGGQIGANALAIPNNTIIITDELIELTDDDQQILAVLAHEQGHLVHRHGLEEAISRLGIGVLMVAITGDASDILVALPTLAMMPSYSQKAELEADKFAIDTLVGLGISPKHLADFFDKMQAQDDSDDDWSMLSTHPTTDERIRQVNQHSH